MIGEVCEETGEVEVTGEVREELEGEGDWEGEGKEMKWNMLNDGRGESVGGGEVACKVLGLR